MTIEALKSEMVAYHSLKNSDAFKMAIAYAKVVTAIVENVHDLANLSIDRAQLIKELPMWEEAASMQIAAQKQYIGDDLKQGQNKARHSLEVGKGVAIAYRSVCRAMGLDICDTEEQYIEYRGHLHDAGRILNLENTVLRCALDEKTLQKVLADAKMSERFDELKGKSSLDIVKPAAEALHAQYGDALGSIDEIAEAICYTAVSDRQGPLFKEAQAFVPDIKTVIRAYFHRQDIHNPVYLRGFQSYAAHHDAVLGLGTTPDTRGEYSNFSKHGALDYLAILIDNVSAATGDAQSLDEIALWLVVTTKQSMAALEQGKKPKLHPGYARFILEDYGTGNSILEQMHMAWVDGGYNRVPDGVVNANKKDLLRVLKLPNSELQSLNDDYQNPFPQLAGGWSSLGSDEAGRQTLAARIEESGAIGRYVRQEIKGFTQLTTEQVHADLKNVQSEALIYRISFDTYIPKPVGLNAALSRAWSFAVVRRGPAPVLVAPAPSSEIA